MIWFAIGCSYLLGSIPFGVLIGRLRGVDVRAVGSGNIGATNVYRALGPVAGLSVFALDVSKGLAGPLIGKALIPSTYPQFFWGVAACAVAAVIGHIYSVFLKGTGGKGIATALGAIVGLAPWVALAAFALWGIVLSVSRIISVASIVACIGVTIGAWTTDIPVAYAIVITIMAVLAFVKHIPNMKRLAAGTEPKIARKKGKAASPLTVKAAQSTLESVSEAGVERH
ncbi:MAG: acyl phosphate:glycerol-3-phosphate acyltransferase [Abditibacteriota bacterium]|nr:acyl phosphate:glycerol-3-phosphate acyltransferase [Abditibacteriota bacterium]